MRLRRFFVMLFFLGVVYASFQLFWVAVRPLPEVSQTVWIEISHLAEARKLTVTWPKSVRLDETVHLRMELGIPEDNLVGGRRRYEAYQAAVEARLELPGLHKSPEGVLITALSPDAPIRLEWTIIADQNGHYMGTLWLYLNLTTRNGGKTDQVALVAMPVEIETEEDIIFSPGVCRGIGLAGMAIGMFFMIWTVFKK